MAGQGPVNFPRTKLRSPVRVKNATGHVFTSDHGILDGLDGQPSLHAAVDGVAHNPVGAGVLDGAEIELPFCRGVLGDVGQPQLVRDLGTELTAHQVVVGRGRYLGRLSGDGRLRRYYAITGNGLEAVRNEAAARAAVLDAASERLKPRRRISLA
jgi:hypothetical protein